MLYDWSDNISLQYPRKTWEGGIVYKAGDTKLKRTVALAGYHAVKWDGRNEQGWQVSSGIYFYRIEIKSKDAGQRPIVALKKMILMKLEEP